MRVEQQFFSNTAVDYVFGCNISEALSNYAKSSVFFITDENVYKKHANIFGSENYFVIAPGEANKTQATADAIIHKLLELNADKQTTIVGVGGGVVTDIAGYVSSIYKRGIRLVLAPTSLLAMTDAAIGGKNGVNVGEYKNMVGTTYQPTAILFDYSFLSTLPQVEWINGFAEIIKHACIKSSSMFAELEKNNIAFYKSNPEQLAKLIEANVGIKNRVVTNDEFETGDRKLLNFGHTIGHAIENIYNLPHGYAVSLGMVAACRFSEEMNNFYSIEKEKVIALLQQYELPIKYDYDKEKLWSNLQKDKKTEGSYIYYILLNKIGEGIVNKMPLVQLQSLIERTL